MTPTMKDLGIDQLTPQQRISLALEIWESLGNSPLRTRLSSEQRAELARRDAELDANPSLTLTWEQVRDQTVSLPREFHHESAKFFCDGR